MKMKTGALVLGGLLFGAAALLPSISEGRGGSGRAGRCGQTECRQLNQDCPENRQHLRDGSCGNAACPRTGRGRGNCYGPGDGTGQGPSPKDGGAAAARP